MALSDIEQTRTTDLNTATTSYTAGQEPWNKNLDGYRIENESTEAFTYQSHFEQWHGIYRNVAELASVTDIEARWIVGKKLIMSDATKKIVDRFRGNGKQTFRDILINILRVSLFNGDSYTWAPRDKAGRLLNLKMLDPGTIRVEADGMAVIKKYVQVAQKNTSSQITMPTDQEELDSWEPKEIFHIMNDAIADEIHGIPNSEKLLTIIKMRQQGMSDTSVIHHRYGKPTFFYEANTDDEAEMEKIKNTIDLAVKNFENVVVPKDTLTSIERTATPQFSSLDTLPWQKFLRSYFTEASNVPDLVRGKSDEVSLAAGKLNYLGFKEKIIFKQIAFSEQLKMQLGLEIEFPEPQEIDLEIAKTGQEVRDRNNAKETKTMVTGRDPSK